MDDLAAIRAAIPDYADYADVDARHQTDKQVRAYLGEALSEARERLRPAGDLAERLDGLILRCEFTDQRVMRAADHARVDATLAARVHELDRRLVDCADRVRTAGTAEELARVLDDIACALDERAGAFVDAPTR
jgi:hypothetical protein